MSSKLIKKPNIEQKNGRSKSALSPGKRTKVGYGWIAEAYELIYKTMYKLTPRLKRLPGRPSSNSELQLSWIPFRR